MLEETNGLRSIVNNGTNIIETEEKEKIKMGKLLGAIKQFKEVVELRDENKLLYDEKEYYRIELEEKDKQYEITKKRCQQYYKLFNAIKEETNKNQNGSVINLQNKIKRLLKESKL
jgi:hypothetical protein